MEQSDDKDWEFISKHPYSEQNAELRIDSEEIDFLLPREKRFKKYTVVFTAKWHEIIAFECAKIHYCKDRKSWPTDEELPDDYDKIGQAGIFFAFLRSGGEAFFQVWAIIPVEDIPKVRELAEEYLGRKSVDGLAHHGNAGVVNYVLDRCEIVHRITLNWHDWIKSGPSTEPREKLNEKPPDLVLAKEGMAFDFYGASPKLEQMSTFWPWRLIKDIHVVPDEVPQLAYVWYEDEYTFLQQVWDEKERRQILDKVKETRQMYINDDDIPELKMIRPWSFPSRLHDTWDDLKPFASQASRDGFPPIYETED